MRRPRSAQIAAFLTIGLTGTIVVGQIPSGERPAPRTEGASAAVDPMLAARGARHLLRNGLDYIDYKEYEKALAYLRAAESRQQELSPDELEKLVQGIDRARRGLREPNQGRTAVATRPTGVRRPGVTLPAPEPIQLTGATMTQELVPSKPESAPASAPAAIPSRIPPLDFELPDLPPEPPVPPAPMRSELPSASGTAGAPPTFPSPAAEEFQGPTPPPAPLNSVPSPLPVSEPEPAPPPPPEPLFGTTPPVPPMVNPAPAREVPRVAASQPEPPTIPMARPAPAATPFPPSIPPPDFEFPPLPPTSRAVPASSTRPDGEFELPPLPRSRSFETIGGSLIPPTNPGRSPLDDLPPEIRREVDRIALKQDEEQRTYGPLGPRSGFSGLGGETSQLIVPRPPSPTEPRPILAIPDPDDVVPLGPREFTPNRKYWAAAATCHGPLYFQDAALERYGQSVEQALGPVGRFFSYPLDDPTQSNQRMQLLQPFASIGLFAYQIAAWPIHAVFDPPTEAEYDLGYYRPGDRIPPDTIYVPLTGVGPLFRGKRYP